MEDFQVWNGICMDVAFLLSACSRKSLVFQKFWGEVLWAVPVSHRFPSLVLWVSHQSCAAGHDQWHCWEQGAGERLAPLSEGVWWNWDVANVRVSTWLLVVCSLVVAVLVWNIMAAGFWVQSRWKCSWGKIVIRVCNAPDVLLSGSFPLALLVGNTGLAWLPAAALGLSWRPYGCTGQYWGQGFMLELPYSLTLYILAGHSPVSTVLH